MTETNPKAGSFADLFQQSIRQFKEGEVVRGTVLSVDPDHIIVVEGDRWGQDAASLRDDNRQHMPPMAALIEAGLRS